MSGSPRDPDSDAGEKLLGYEQDDDSLDDHMGYQRPWTVRPYILTLFIVILCVFSAFLGAVIENHQRQGDQDALCLRHTSQESPLTPDIHVGWHKVRFNGSLLKENVYRRRAGPEVDAAWDALGVNYRSVVVPVDQAPRVGFRDDQVKISAKHGGGFPASVEGMHHLHCLNVVRQALYFNIDYYREQGKGAFTNKEHILQKHITHCLDIIRQQLMCTVDVGVFGQVWFQPVASEAPEAYVDFNTEHVCRNFDDIRKWAEDHQLPSDVPGDFLEPPKEGDRIFRTLP